MALTLSSPAFQNRGVIPKEFTGEGVEKSPPLEWHGAPAGTKSFALIADDRDVPKGSFVHWVIYNIPASAKRLSEHIPKTRQLADGTQQGLNQFKKIGYNGPLPPAGKAHRYYFKLFALNGILKLPSGTSRDGLMKAMTGKILSHVELMGTFQATGIGAKQKRATKKASPYKWVATASGPSKLEREAAKRLETEDDKYIMWRGKVEKRLRQGYGADPATIKDFFKQFSFTSAMAMKKVKRYLKELKDKDLREVLTEYVKFATRFHVMFRLRTNPLRFKAIAWPQYGEKFHVRYVTARQTDGKFVGEHLEPASRSVPPTDPYIDYFDDDRVVVSKTVQKLIKDKKATFIRIEDPRGGYSILKNLEAFAYRPDGVTIIEHHAEHPYFICIFGEDAKKNPLIGQVGTALTEFQNKYYDRGRAGKHPDVEELKKAMVLKMTKLSNIAQAAELVPEGNEKQIKAKEVMLSQLEKKLRNLK